MTTETIFTLDARDNMFLEVAKDFFELDDDTIHSVINEMFEDCISILGKKKISYKEPLKAVLFRAVIKMKSHSFLT